MRKGLLLLTLPLLAVATCVFGDAPLAEPGPRGAVLGLVLETHGTITPGPTTSLGRDAPPAPWAPLYDGDAFYLAPGADLTILCRSGACRTLELSFIFGEATCSDSDTGSCSDVVVPSSSPARDGERLVGEWLATDGRLELLGHARGSEERWGHDPILVSPRCPASGPLRGCETWLDDPRELVFLAVDNADYYRFSLTGPGRFEPLTVPAGQLDGCRPWPDFDGSPVCRHPWPENWRLPESGLPVRLRLQVEVAGQLRTPEYRERLQRALPDERKRAFDRVPGLAGDLLRALAHASSGAGADLFASLAGRDDLPPALELEHAQLYLERDFPRPAHRLFSRLVGAGPQFPPRLAAEVELGLAHTAFLLDEPEEARRQLRRAERAFECLDLETRRKEIDELRRRIASISRPD